MFNFFVIDDLRNQGHINHDMYLKTTNEESVDILLNQSIVIKHLRERQLLVLNILSQKTNEILAEITRGIQFQISHQNKDFVLWKQK